jgi:hypothetical protein
VASDSPTARRASPGVATALFASLVAVVASVSTLVFTFWPELKPDPRATQQASLRIVALEPRVTRDEWLRRTSDDRDEWRRLRQEYVERASLPGEADDPAAVRQLLRAPGDILFVRTVIKGYKRRNVTMLWSLYDRGTGARVRERAYWDVKAFNVSLDAPTDASVVQVWIPEDPGRERSFARVELVARDGTTLAIGDSGALPDSS